MKELFQVLEENAIAYERFDHEPVFTTADVDQLVCQNGFEFLWLFAANDDFRQHNQRPEQSNHSRADAA